MSSRKMLGLLALAIWVGVAQGGWAQEEVLLRWDFEDQKTSGWTVSGGKQTVEPLEGRPGNKFALFSGMQNIGELVVHHRFSEELLNVKDLAVRFSYLCQAQEGGVDMIRVFVRLPGGYYRECIIAPPLGQWQTAAFRLQDVYHYGDGLIGKQIEGIDLRARRNLGTKAISIMLDDVAFFQATGPLPKPMVPIKRLAHPRLFYSPQEIEQIRDKIKRLEWAAYLSGSTESVADGWLKKEVYVPKKKGGYPPRLIACQKCGKPSNTMRYDHSKRNLLTCASCGAVRKDDVDSFAPDAPWTERYSCAASAWRAEAHTELGRAVKALGLAYAISQEEKYAGKAREILLGYAQQYPKYSDDGNLLGGQKAFPYRQAEQHWISDLITGYDLVWNSPGLTDADKLAIENHLFRECARVLVPFSGSKNLWLWNADAVAAIGFCLGDQSLIDFAIDGAQGFRRILADWVDDDGSWVEAHPGYFCYALQATETMCEMAYRSGIDFYQMDKIRKFFAYPIINSFPDLTWQDIRLPIDQIETAYRRYHDPIFAWAIQEANKGPRAMRRASLLSEEKVQEVRDFRLPSVNFEKRGNALLRAGEGDQAICVHFDYEPRMAKARGWKLKTMPFAHGRLLHPKKSIFYDRLWNNATLAYNTVVVDERAQALSDGKLIFFGAAPQVSMIDAEANDAYPDSDLRRTLVLTDRYLLDFFRVASDRDRRIDWFYHNRGELECPLQLESRPGRLGIAEGYFEIIEVKKGGADSNWEALWHMKERDDRERITLRSDLDGEQLGSKGGKHLSPAVEAIWRSSIPQSLVITDRKTHLGSKAAVSWVTEAMGKEGGEWWLNSVGARHSDIKALATVLFVQASTKDDLYASFSYYVEADPKVEPSLTVDVYDDQKHYSFPVQPLKLNQWCTQTISIKDLTKGKYAGYLRSLTFVLSREKVEESPFNIYLDNVVVSQGKDETPPRAIDDLMAVRQGAEVELTWSIPRDDHSGIAYFDVYAGRSATFSPDQAQKLNQEPLTDAHQFLDRGGAKNKRYYWVEAVDYFGNKSLSNRARPGSKLAGSPYRGTGMRLTMLGEDPTQVITGVGASGEASPLVVARRRAKETVFISTLEPYSGKPVVRRISKLPATMEGQPCLQSEAAGVSVETDQSTEQVLVSYQPGPKKYGAISFDGLIGVLSWSKGGEIRYAYLGKGKTLSSGKVAIGSDTESSLYLEHQGDKRYLVENQGEKDANLTIQVPLGKRPVVYLLDDQGQRKAGIHAKSLRGRMEFPAQAGASYQIVGSDQ